MQSKIGYAVASAIRNSRERRERAKELRDVRIWTRGGRTIVGTFLWAMSQGIMLERKGKIQGRWETGGAESLINLLIARSLPYNPTSGRSKPKEERSRTGSLLGQCAMECGGTIVQGDNHAEHTRPLWSIINRRGVNSQYSCTATN